MSGEDFSVEVYLCVEFLDLWEGKEERRASLQIMSRLVVSVRLGTTLRICTLGYVVLCGGVRDLAEQELTRAAGGV